MSIQRACSNVGMFLIAALLTALPARAAALYGITDLGTIDGTYSSGSSINDVGQVTGESAEHAFLYSGGVMNDLGTSNDAAVSFGYGINDAGQVAGYNYGPAGSRAFLYSSGVMTDLGTLGGSSSEAGGINNLGQVTGTSYTSGDKGVHVFLYSAGAMIDLGGLGGTYARGTAINDVGQVTGYGSTPGGAQHAFLYSGGVMTDLGTLGGTYGAGFAINNAGQVTGYGSTSGNSAQHAFLYSGGVMTDLGTLGGAISYGLGINEAGTVTGWSNTSDGAFFHAFIYDGGLMTDLNDLIDPSAGWELYDARDINNLGQITGTGFVNGEYHAFLLTPLAAVPEPASWAMMIVGFGFIGGVLRRQRQSVCWFTGRASNDRSRQHQIGQSRLGRARPQHVSAVSVV